MRSLYRFLILLILTASIPCCLAGQSAHPQRANQSYDALVQQGNTNLQAGSNDQALALANSAIKMNADRWEGYALAGGALIDLKRYEEAADRLSDAIKRAPEAKQTGLRDLRKQCLLAEAGLSSSQAQSSAPAVASNTSPAQSSLQEALSWITANTPSHPSFYQALRGPQWATYFQKIAFSGCMATLTSGNHVRDEMTGFVSSTMFDLSKLDPDAISIKAHTYKDNTEIVVGIHSVEGITVNTANYLHEAEASVADTHQYSREDDSKTTNDVYVDVDDQSGGERMKQAWHDAIVGCVNGAQGSATAVASSTSSK